MSTVDGAPIPADRPLVIGSHEFESRLFLGTGKYDDLQVMQEALRASGTQCVTVAVRRIKLGVPEGKTLLDYLDTARYTLLPNTAGCFTAEDAVQPRLTSCRPTSERCHRPCHRLPAAATPEVPASQAASEIVEGGS